MSLLWPLMRTVPRRLPKLPAIAITPSRSLSETSEQVLINMDGKGVATMQLNHGPANALNLEFLTSLHIAMDKVLSQKDCKGIILTSTLNGIFSAGLDFREIYQPDKARLHELHRSLQEFWIKLHGCAPVTIAAINGHSPAGGCVVACACDYRIMAEGGFTIGLNITKLGLVSLFWFTDVISNIIGHRETELALQLGRLFSPEEAERIKLVDDVAPMDQIMTRAQAEMDRWLQIPEAARVLTKRMMRQPFINKLRSQQREDTEKFVNFFLRDSVQKTLQTYVETLKKKSSNKI